MTAGSGIDTDFPSCEHSELVDRPVATDGPSSLGDTPPSSDSGIHSLGEQWENMSISTIDMESEQNERPTNCSPMGRRGSDTRVPPKTEENEYINYPWTDCVLNEESDEFSSIDIPKYSKDIQYNDVTICEEENSSVNSGTDGGNSDIGVLADFSDVEEGSQVEQLSGCRIPGCQCEGHIEYMEWGSDDMTETDDSEWESPNSEPTVQPGTVADEDIPTVRDKKDNRGRRRRTVSDEDISSDECSKLFDRQVTESVTAWPGRDSHCPSDEYEYWVNFGLPVTEARTARAGNDAEISSDECSDLFDQPVTESATAWAGSDTDFTSEEDLEFLGRPVTESMTARSGSDTDYPSGEHLEFCNRPVTESVTAWAADTEELLVMNVSTVTIELSELRTRVLGETDTSDIPVYKECCTPKRHLTHTHK